MNAPRFPDSRSPRQRGVLRTFLAAVLILSLGLASIPLANVSVAQASDSLAAYVPGDSVVYVEVELDPDSDQAALAKELIERANFEALLPESEQDSLDESIAMAEGMVNGDAAFFVVPSVVEGLSVDKLADDAAGLADDPMGAAGDLPSGWGAVIRPDDPQALFDMIMQGTDDVAMDASEPDSTPDATSGSPGETTEYEGYEILYMAPGYEGDTGEAIALVDDVIVAATTVEDVQLVIDVVTGTTDSLANSDNFTSIRGALPEQTLVNGYLDGPALTELVAASGDPDLAQIPDELLAQYASYQGFAVWADDPGFRMDSVAIPAEGVELPVADAYDPTLTDLIPSDALVFAGGTNIGANPGLDSLALVFAAEIAGISPDTMATPVDPEALSEEVFAEAEEVLGFNLKTDVLDQLSGEWAVAGTTDLSTGAALFVSEVGDPEVVTGVVDHVTMMIAASSDESVDVSSRTVGDAEVTVIEVDADGLPLTIEFGVVDGKLAIGINGWIDNLEVAPDSALSDDDAFQDALGYVTVEDGVTTNVAYVDLEAVLPMVMELSNSLMLTVEDADPSCGEYATQAEAQEALDEDSFENYLLDQDWDGEACEDFFAPATPVAGDEVESPNVTAIAVSAWAQEDLTGSSAILVIGE